MLARRAVDRDRRRNVDRVPECAARFLERNNGFGTGFSDNPDVRAGNDPTCGMRCNRLTEGASAINAAT